MGRPFRRQNRPFALADIDPIWYMVNWANLGPQPKRHFDRFGGFYRAYDRHRQTDRARYSVCNNRLHLRSTAMRPNNYSVFSNFENSNNINKQLLLFELLLDWNSNFGYIWDVVRFWTVISNVIWLHMKKVKNPEAIQPIIYDLWPGGLFTNACRTYDATSSLRPASQLRYDLFTNMVAKRYRIVCRIR